MMLNITTDYAIRIVLYCAMQEKDSKPVSIAQISEAMQIPQNYISLVAKKLHDAGILQVTRGRYGGYRLGKNSEEISLLDVIELMEGPITINRCLEPDHYCSRGAAEICPVRKNYENIQCRLKTMLDEVAIANLM